MTRLQESIEKESYREDIDFNKSILSHSAILWNDLHEKKKKKERGIWFIVYESMEGLKKYNEGRGGCKIYFKSADQLLESQYMSEDLKFMCYYDVDKYFVIFEMIIPREGFKVNNFKCVLVPIVNYKTHITFHSCFYTRRYLALPATRCCEQH